MGRQQDDPSGQIIVRRCGGSGQYLISENPARSMERRPYLCIHHAMRDWMTKGWETEVLEYNPRLPFASKEAERRWEYWDEQYD